MSAIKMTLPNPMPPKPMFAPLQLIDSTREIICFQSPTEKEHTILTTKTFIIRSLPVMLRGVRWRISIQSHIILK